ncbi:Hypothetical predicted protein [Xyrichtys novacula]|uniref:Uncharacterized protein n=1 Tax=Xyrichtys novacula TaxID=13765 RepID=A0AAV1EVM8_XYRNO|nr:Hypothetical predicted protein [Xyrichtys novacula]
MTATPPSVRCFQLKPGDYSADLSPPVRIQTPEKTRIPTSRHRPPLLPQAGEEVRRPGRDPQQPPGSKTAIKNAKIIKESRDINGNPRDHRELQVEMNNQRFLQGFSK